MRTQRRLNSLLIGLLIIASLSGACSPANAGTIDGSVNIPIRDLAKSPDKLPADKNAPIVTYCAVGQRGAIAMTALRLLGYTNVKSMGGGFNAWVKAYFPVVK